jgi:hypothetical protein
MQGIFYQNGENFLFTSENEAKINLKLQEKSTLILPNFAMPRKLKLSLRFKPKAPVLTLGLSCILPEAIGFAGNLGVSWARAHDSKA